MAKISLGKHIHIRIWLLHNVVVSNVHNKLPVEVRCGGSLVIVGDVNGRLPLLHYTIRVHIASRFVRLFLASMYDAAAIPTSSHPFIFRLDLISYKHIKSVRG